MQSIAHYQVLEKIGEGGMGAVYKAIDTHLQRVVALKLLPADKVSDPERRRRFIQEAQAASALNHPNIITIHDAADAAGVHFIAMEYVDGQTLREAIDARGLPLREVLDYGIQIADALAAAHASGIVHRDLKPANVMVASRETVKVLDFGVAKLIDVETAGIASGEQSTVSAMAGTAGMIVGTTPYMSPEQVEGRKVDPRSDIFAFGTVLYEMTTGQRAFKGESALSTMSAILREQPIAASTVTASVPRELERVIERCLKKNPAERFQHIADVKIRLQELREDLAAGRLDSPEGTATQQRSLGGKWTGAAAVIGTVAIVTAAIWWWPRSSSSPMRLTAVPLTSYPGSEFHPSLSPDGNQVAFSWDGERQDNYDIYVKLVGPGAPHRLTTSPAADTSPAWSPDGQWIAFLRLTSDQPGALIVIPALGGPERQLGNVASLPFMIDSIGRAIAWTPDSSSLIVGAGGGSPADPEGLFVLSLSTGERRRLTTLPQTNWIDTGPALSPDRRLLTFTRFSSFGLSDLYALTLTEDLQPLGEPKRVTYQTGS